MAKDGQGAGRFGQSMTCDLPYETCKLQMEWFKQNLRGQRAPDLILWTGDNTNHDMAHVTEDEIV